MTTPWFVTITGELTAGILLMYMTLVVFADLDIPRALVTEPKRQPYVFILVV